MKYAFIDQHRNEFPVSLMCRELAISRARYYAFKKEPVSMHSRVDLALRQHIVRIAATHRWTPGSLKTWRLLNAQGIRCGKHRVARLRKLEGIQSTRTRKFRVMAAKDRSQPPSPDLVKRAFQVAAPNRVWVGDMTAIRTREGWLHLAVVLDLYARRVVGWATDTIQVVGLPAAAMQMAIVQRKPATGLIFHSDQGSAYSATCYRALLAKHGVRPSMSRKGNCHDNAVAESFFSNLKNEVMQDRFFSTRDEARAVINDYIEVYYNRLRVHQSLDYQTPEQVEAQFRVLH
ncbi:MAG: IS3 family transposase [Pseudomonadota bacterium]